MSINQAYNSLRGALAQEAKAARLEGKPSFEVPSDLDCLSADGKIDSMPDSMLLVALKAHEETAD